MATGRTPVAPRPGFAHHNAWALVLAGGIVMGLALGARHAQGLFLLPVSLERGWSRETFGLAIALQNLVWGIAQPFAGMIADRFGSAKVIAGGLAFNALGLVLMAQAATPAAFLWSAGVCIGIGLSGSTFGAVYGALSRLVVAERRGWALGLAGAIGGLGQFAMVPATQGLIDGLGWAGALVALAIACAILLPLALPLADRVPPASAAGTMHEGGAAGLAEAIREAFRHRGFWLLNLGFFACGFQLAFIATCRRTCSTAA
jgi:MFS family permease